MSWAGLYRGVVVTAADPLGQDRVRLRVPQVSGTATTGWAPPVQAGGGVPVVGQAVWVMYEGQDASYPVYFPPSPEISFPQPYPPLVTAQTREPSYSQVQTWVDFTSAEFPSITFTVPDTGMFLVTVAGRVRNDRTTTATAWLNYRVTGDYSTVVDDTTGLVCMNVTRMQASIRSLVSGAPPGGTVTVVPVWNVSSYTSGQTQVVNGHLLVERVGMIVE